MTLLEKVQEGTHKGIESARMPPGFTSFARIIPGATPEMFGEVESYLKSVQREIRRPTKYEHPELHSLLQMLASLIDKQVAAHGRWRAPADSPVFGLMRTGRVNARTIRVPANGDYIVLIDEAMFTFLELLGKVVVSALPEKETERNGRKLLTLSTDLDDIRPHLGMNSDAVHRFTDLVLAYVVDGRLTAAEPYSLDPQRMGYASALTMAGEMYVIAHEYVHVLERHLADGLVTTPRVVDGKIEQSLLSVVREGAADMFGLPLVGAAMADVGYERSFSMWGASVFLFGNLIMAKAIPLLRTGNEQGWDDVELHRHAIFHARVTALNYILEDMLKGTAGNRPDSTERQASFVKGLHAMEAVITELWERAIPFLKLCHRYGMRPAARWSS